MMVIAATTQPYPTMGRPANTGISVEIIPAAGRKMMYTSGWPNSQKRCCHNTGSPPPAIWKNGMPTARSSSNNTLPKISGGKPTTIISAMARMYHANSGILCSAMPWVRVRKIDTTSSTPAESADISTKVMPSSQKSEPKSGANSLLLSGVYINQPLEGAISIIRLEVRIIPPNR